MVFTVKPNVKRKLRVMCPALPYITALASVLVHPPTKKLAPALKKMCQPPLSSLQPSPHGIVRLGQCHFPLCMWIKEIRLSTVIVHCVEPSVTRMFSGISLRRKKKKKKKKAEQMNDWLQEKDKNVSQHEQAFIVLCIYAIVYVWIWRIWKYMLTNLYRVFYVMWNTWSRCSLLSLALHLFLSFVFSFFLFFLIYFSKKKEHIRRTGFTLLTDFWTYKATSVHNWDAGFRQICRFSLISGREEHRGSFLQTKALKGEGGRLLTAFGHLNGWKHKMGFSSNNYACKLM